MDDFSKDVVPFRPRRIRRAVSQAPGELTQQASNTGMQLKFGKVAVTGRPLKILVQAGVAVFLAWALWIAVNGNPFGAAAGTLVIMCAMLPTIIWVNRGAKGFPIFPLYAATFSWSFGLQMLQNRQLLVSTPPALYWKSCFTLCLFLLIGTAVWNAVVTKPVKPRTELMMVGGPRSQPVLLTGMLLATMFHMATAAGWMHWAGAYGTILRAFLYCYGSLSTFLLAHDIGMNKLDKNKKAIYFACIILTMMAMGCGLLLVQAMSVAALGLAGYIIASRRFPWKVFLIFFPIMYLLHYGKYPMREKYWHVDQGEIIWSAFRPWDYPKLYWEWFQAGIEYATHPKKYAGEERTNLLERTGLLHLFIFAQSATDRAGFLGGKTYMVLPQLLIPRVLAPRRAGAHETTTLLNVYFGIQSREETENTTVGWGLFNEAYANFGYFGPPMLAVVLGLFFGWATRYSMGCPVNSFQGLFAIIVMNTSYQTEYSSGVFVTVLFQSLVSLIGLRYVIMQPVRIVDTEAAAPPPPKPASFGRRRRRMAPGAPALT